MNLPDKLSSGILILTCSTLIACGGGGGGGGGSDNFSVGGSLGGLGSGKTIVLQNNGEDDLSLTANGGFTFSAKLGDGAAYAVSIQTLPDGQKCTVTNGSGSVTGANITNVAVACEDAPPTDRFVISGNNDGTLSIFRNTSMTDYATAMAYFDAGGGVGIQDMIYDQDNGRIVLITASKILVLGFDANTGDVSVLDSGRDTSGNSSHLTVNAAGTAAYVASGSSGNEAIDMFPINASGTLGSIVSSAQTVDPDYITLNPAGTHLFLVSRDDNQVLAYSVNSDNSLSSSPVPTSTATTPTALGFSSDGSKAYLTRANSSGSLIEYDVAGNGSLTQTASFSNSNSAIDMTFNADRSQLYVLDSGNKNIDRYSIAANGALTYQATTNLSFTPTDITLGHTGERLYVSHSEDDLVSTIDISSNGSLSVAGWARAFSNAQTIASVGADGALEATPTYLLAPDQSGLHIFETADNGMLTQKATINVASALIEGQVAVNENDGLLLGAGTNAAEENLLTSYRFNPNTAETTQGDVHVINTTDATEPTRLSLGKSGRFMYVLDVGDNFPDESFIRSYAYDASGTTIINATAIDTDSMSINKGPENMAIAPDGNYLYSVNSFNDTIAIYRIGRSNGSLTFFENFTPGNFGSQVGRPIDIKFHPNGRYAYVSLEDDRELVRFEVEPNGRLSGGNTVVPPGTDINPGPMAIHPNGEYLYSGERSPGAISVYTIDSGIFTLSYQSRVTTTSATPSWLEIDPQGRFLYVRYNDETIEVFSINQSTGDLTSIQSGIAAGTSGGFLPTLTLVAPIQ